MTEDNKKLFPELDTDSDNQIVIVGALLALGLLLFFGSQLFGGEEDILSINEDAITTGDDQDSDANADDDEEVEAEAEVEPVVEEPEGFEALVPVVSPLAGVIAATRGDDDPNVVTLTGFVANEGEKQEAEEDIRAVSDVDDVENELVILEPSVTEALVASDVVNATARGEGATISVEGTVSSEDARAVAIEAAEGVEGVDRVVDQLEVNALDVINNLPQVEFATGSAQILPTSFDNLSRAAEILSSTDAAAIEVQGYTDTVGDLSLIHI